MAHDVAVSPSAEVPQDMRASALVALLPKRDSSGALCRVHVLLASFTLPDDEYTDVADMCARPRVRRGRATDSRCAGTSSARVCLAGS